MCICSLFILLFTFYSDVSATINFTLIFLHPVHSKSTFRTQHSKGRKWRGRRVDHLTNIRVSCPKLFIRKTHGEEWEVMYKKKKKESPQFQTYSHDSRLSLTPLHQSQLSRIQANESKCKNGKCRNFQLLFRQAKKREKQTIPHPLTWFSAHFPLTPTLIDQEKTLMF